MIARHQPIVAVLITATVMLTGGATCNRQVASPFPPPPPIAISATPTIDEIATAINRSQNVREISCNNADIEITSMPSLPRLSATMHARRDRDLRLRAKVPLVLGSGIDIGSNDQQFWFEVPEGLRKVMYHARHDQYAALTHRQVLPVDPTWFIDAIGLPEIDPTTVIAGPLRRSDGAIEVHTTLPDQSGLRIAYVDPAAGYVTDQFIYDDRNRLIARSTASQAVYYPTGETTGAVLPHRVELAIAPESGPPLTMAIQIGSYSVNQLLSGEPDLFQMPTSTTAVDLASLAPPASHYQVVR